MGNLFMWYKHIYLMLFKDYVAVHIMSMLEFI